MKIFQDDDQKEVLIHMTLKEGRDLVAALERAVDQPVKAGKLKGTLVTTHLNPQSNAYKLARKLVDDLPVFV